MAEYQIAYGRASYGTGTPWNRELANCWDEFAVGDYLELRIDNVGVWRETVGVITAVSSRVSQLYEVTLQHEGPAWLKCQGWFVPLQRNAAPTFCAHCFQDEHEHVGGRCLYSFFRYRSIKEVY